MNMTNEEIGDVKNSVKRLFFVVVSVILQVIWLAYLTELDNLGIALKRRPSIFTHSHRELLGYLLLPYKKTTRRRHAVKIVRTPDNLIP